MAPLSAVVNSRVSGKFQAGPHMGEALACSYIATARKSWPHRRHQAAALDEAQPDQS
jgi:hypothetical protein